MTETPGALDTAAARLGARIEVHKLAAELDVEPEELGFLADRSVPELRRFRAALTTGLFKRHEHRFHRVATLAGLVPVQIAAKAAQLALGPVVAARVASVLDPAHAAKMAGILPRTFLTEVTLSLDPSRASAIIERLPEDVIVRVGTDLARRHEVVTLARFVGTISAEVAAKVVVQADPADLLTIALYAEDAVALDEIIGAIPDEVVNAVLVQAHHDHEEIDALTLLTSLRPESRERLLRLVAGQARGVREGFIAAVIAARGWPELLPYLDALKNDELSLLVNSDQTRDVQVLDEVIATARGMDLGKILVRLVLVLDDDHVDALRDSQELAVPAVQRWLHASSGISQHLLVAVLDGLGILHDGLVGSA